MSHHYTVEQFAEEPEVWNILDTDGNIVAQEDSKADAEGMAGVYESHFQKGVDSQRAEIARLKSVVRAVVEACHRYIFPDIESTYEDGSEIFVSHRDAETLRTALDAARNEVGT